MDLLLWLLGVMMAVVLGSPAATAAVEPSQPPDFGCYRIITSRLDDYTVKVESDAFFTDDVTVVSRTYYFGDGTTVTTANKYGGPVVHTYKGVDDYRINVVFRFSVNGHVSMASGSNCTTNFTAGQAPPIYVCDTLTATRVGTTTFRFDVNATVMNGARITGIVYDFGDGTMLVTNKLSVTHSYATSGEYPVTAQLQVKINGNSATCETVATLPAIGA